MTEAGRIYMTVIFLAVWGGFLLCLALNFFNDYNRDSAEKAGHRR